MKTTVRAADPFYREPHPVLADDEAGGFFPGLHSRAAARASSTFFRRQAQAPAP